MVIRSLVSRDCYDAGALRHGIGRVVVLFAGLALLAPGALAQQPAPAAPASPPPGASAANTSAALQARVRNADAAVQRLPTNVPTFFPHYYHSALSAPGFTPKQPALPQEQKTTTQPCAPDTIFSQGGIPATIGKSRVDSDTTGCQGSYQPSGAVQTGSNAFFELLGSNGRTCVTCHQPPSGMSVVPANINARYQATGGTDPIFAGVDGANCPNNLPPNTGNGAAFRAAHSLLLTRGLIRIFLPVPAGAQFRITVISDPYGCNTDPAYDQDTIGGQTAQMISIYRRPRISANLPFVNLPGRPEGPAIMWDTREPSLESQAHDATLGHAQAFTPPSAQQITEMVGFENGIFSAQSYDTNARSLGAIGATGGAQSLSSQIPGQGGPPNNVTFSEYNAWAGLAGNSVNTDRAAIARGQALFNTRTFTISSVAGLNDVSGNPTITGTCSTCHNQAHAGNNLKGKVATLDIGIGGDSTAHLGPPPSPLLPIFQVVCLQGLSTPFNGRSVTTNDPGLALITGQCADIGKFAGPQLRGLAARAPYFTDGSAATLQDVVKFYNQRFSIGFKPSEIQDLVAFLNTL